jgi:hypothetical protein
MYLHSALLTDYHHIARDTAYLKCICITNPCRFCDFVKTVLHGSATYNFEVTPFALNKHSVKTC